MVEISYMVEVKSKVYDSSPTMRSKQTTCLKPCQWMGTYSPVMREGELNKCFLNNIIMYHKW